MNWPETIFLSICVIIVGFLLMAYLGRKKD